jgi:hypothetical protein
MAKKKNEVAYVPITQAPSLKESVNKIELKVIPPYPDKTVKYAAYSKVYLGNNDYRLVPQVPYFLAVFDNNGGTLGTVTLVNQYLYITSLDVQYTIAAANDLNQIYIDPVVGAGAGVAQTLLYCPFTSGNVHLTFDPPVKCAAADEVNSTGVEIKALDMGANSKWSVVVCGFLEEK